MKRKIALLLGMVLTISGLLIGCGGSGDKVAGGQDATTEQKQEEQVDQTEGTLKTGLAILSDVSKSKDAGEEDGQAQANITIAAVTVDEAGKIVSCVIDTAQVKVGFDKEGKLLTDLAAEFPTKQELGDDYGMKKASSIGKEWFEQADAFAAYVVGKTAEEVSGIAVTESGAAADADLAANCTLSIGGFQAIVVKAVNNAVEAGASIGDKLGLGAVTSIGKSKDAAADAEGLAQAYTTVTAVTTNAEGKITSCVIDAVQANVNFDAAGKVTTDFAAEIKTKNELGDGYGMKKASSIGKEWYEQAAAYAAYVVGKTADEVNGIALTEGAPADADLAASVTVHVTDFNSVITKAVNSAE